MPTEGRTDGGRQRGIVHFEFFAPNGFQPGDTKPKNIRLPKHAAGFFVETAIAATATPFDASNEDRQLKVTDVTIRARDPNPPSNDLPTVHVTVESVGPDAPLIWYLNLGIIEL